MRKIFTITVTAFTTITCIAYIASAQVDSMQLQYETAGTYLHPWIGTAALIATIFYEIIARTKTTTRDYSLINLVATTVDHLFPNHAKKEGQTGFLFKRKKVVDDTNENWNIEK